MSKPNASSGLTINIHSSTILTMSWYTLFYWLTVADNLRTFFITAIVITTAWAVIAFFCWVTAETDDGTSKFKLKSLHHTRWAFPFAFFFWMAYLLTPSKRDALFIIAGGGTLHYLSNDPTGKQIPAEMSTFVLTQLKSMSKEAQVELGIQSEKERVLDKVKGMSVEQLISEMKSDSTIRSILLGD